MFVTALLLLARTFRNVTIAIPDSAGTKTLGHDVSKLAEEMGQAVKVSSSFEQKHYEWSLVVGKSDLTGRITSITSDGWLANVVCGAAPSITTGLQDNPIGAVAAACLGVAELFKHVIGLRPRRGRCLKTLQFSLLNYAHEDADRGPSLPASLSLDAVLVGGGAIGNGIIHVLSQLPVAGRLDIIDRQEYEEGNLGTCLLIGESAIGLPKAQVLSNMIKRPLRSTPFVGELNCIYNQIDIHNDTVLISAVDNLETRHEIQRLFWPDIIIDGAIADFPCQVSKHVHENNTACLLCMYKRQSAEPAAKVGAAASGLHLDRIKSPESLITTDDVSKAPQEKKEFLRANIGKTVCSVVSDTVLREIATEPVEAFQASVPFVACMSAVMIVGELVKHSMGLSSPLRPRFQFDLLQGPSAGLFLDEVQESGCICVTRRAEIEELRRQRGENSGLMVSEARSE